MNMMNLSGLVLGQYELRGMLGIGGMGAVYRGFQAGLRREVAVKVMSPQLALQAGYLERFNREAQTAAALEHQHIIPIYDYGMQQGYSYIVMRLLTGGTLAERMEQSNLPTLSETVELLKQLASALDYAHSQGVIHRDIKPSNIMFDNQGTAYLVDFGIAKLTEATQALTASGASMGTPAYMSPEQWRAEELSPSTDQYALGVMIYALLTGRAPFSASTPYALMHKHLNEQPTPPQVIRPELPEAITFVLNRAMAKQPEQRFPTITAFAQAFEGALAGYYRHGEQSQFFTATIRPPQLPNLSLPPSNPQPPTPGTYVLPSSSRPIYKHPLVWILTLMLVGALGLVAVLILSSQQEKESDHDGEGVVQATVNASHTPTATATPDLTETFEFIFSQAQTATAAQWTETPLPPTATRTPNLTQTFEVAFWQAQTATADQWTATPTATHTPNMTQTLEAALIAAQTATAEQWTNTPTPSATNTATRRPPDIPRPTFTPTWTEVFIVTPQPTARAASVEMTEQTFMDGKLTVLCPDDWLAQDMSAEMGLPGITIANSAAALDSATTNQISESGDAAIMVLLLPADLMPMLAPDMTADASVEDLMTIFATQMLSDTSNESDIGPTELITLDSGIQVGYMSITQEGIDGAMMMFKPAPDILVLGVAMSSTGGFTEDLKALGLEVVGSVNYAGTGADLMNALFAG